MKVFNAQGIEKDDNVAVVVELQSTQSILEKSRSLLTRVARELQISNLHFTIMNDTEIEEPP